METYNKTSRTFLQTTKNIGGIMQTTNYIYVAEKINRHKYNPIYSAQTYERANQTMSVLQQLHKEVKYVIVCTRKIFDVKPSEQVQLFDFA